MTVGAAGLPAASAALGTRLGVDLKRLLEVQTGNGFEPVAGRVSSYPLLAGETSELLLLGTGGDTPAELRRAGGALARHARGRTEVGVLVADSIDAAGVQAFTEGAVLGSFTLHRKTTDLGKPVAERIVVTDDLADQPTAHTGRWSEAIERGLVVGRAGWLARELAATPPNEKDPAWLAARATEVAGRHGLGITVWDAERLAAEGFGGIVAVGRGSVRPPRLIRLDYNPPAAGDQTPYVVLVGKGITFDTGGLSLKTRDHMQTMKRDMTGGGSVIAAMSALRDLGCGIRVTGLICAAENMPSGTAYRPDDIVRHYGGRTSEIKDTDAEGRIVLADGLAYAAGELKPDVLVDVATLTGAIRMALGNLLYGGLYATDDALAARLTEAGEVSGERLWRMPLPEAYEELIDSPIADAVNASKAPGGSITAALFLKPFAGGLPWAHLDLSSMAESPADDMEYSLGATGVGARLLTTWLCSADPLAGIG